MEGINSEYIYKQLKLKSKQIKEKTSNEKSLILKNSKIKKNIKINNSKRTNIFPEENNKWFYNSFNTYFNKNDFECPSISEEKWLKNASDKKVPIELRNLIYSLEEEIYYEQFNNLIKANITLKGESKFWIFLHCEEKINEKTVVITISKDEFSKRCFVSLGTFVDKQLTYNEKNILNENHMNTSRRVSVNSNTFHNIDNNIDNNVENNLDNNYDYDNSININNIDNQYEYIIFKTQELVEEISLKDKKGKEKNMDYNRYNSDDNVCFLNIIVFDDGQRINVKIKLNDGKYENEIKGDFFIPTIDFGNVSIISGNYKFHGYKIMIAGSGEGCKVIYFSNEIDIKLQKNGFKNGQNDCQCCNII